MTNTDTNGTTSPLTPKQLTIDQVGKYLLHAFWHGFSPAVLSVAASAGAVATANARLPMGYEWLIVISGALVSFVNGVNSFITDPNK